MNKVIDELRENKKFVVSIFIAIVLMAGISYAWYTLVINKDTSLNLRGKTGLDIELVEPADPITVSTAIPMADADGLATTAYQFKVVSNDSENIAYQLYLDDVELENGENRIPDSNIKYSLTKNGGNENPALLTTTHKTVNNETVRELDDTIINGKTTTAVENVYTLKLWIDSEATTAISGYKFKAKLRLEATQTENSAAAPINPHIKAVYEYDQNGSGTGAAYTGCLGGEEAGCVDIKSTVTANTTYSLGDIVKYEVKDGTELYFNVIKDNGSTLTLQQRENTVANTAWYEAAEADGSNGPTTILAALEDATSSWTNVNTMNYSIGDDTKTLGYSMCDSPTSCTRSRYTLTKTSKVRMITAQELAPLGCNAKSDKSCKKFVYNYLKNATSYGGTFKTDANSNYWTMSIAYPSTNYAWYVIDWGRLNSNFAVNDSNCGGRAVVEINK